MNCSLCHASVTGSPSAMPTGGWVNPNPTPTERDWRLNVLRRHDQKNAGNANYSTLLSSKGYGASLESSVTKPDPSRNKPILCDTCHNSNALAYWGLAGVAGVSAMTAAMHNRHASVTLPGSAQRLDSIGTRDSCYNCHPGKGARNACVVRWAIRSTRRPASTRWNVSPATETLNHARRGPAMTWHES